MVRLSRALLRLLLALALAAPLGFVVAGCEPEEMGIGPVFAVPKLLEKHGLKIDDIDRRLLTLLNERADLVHEAFDPSPSNTNIRSWLAGMNDAGVADAARIGETIDDAQEVIRVK